MTAPYLGFASEDDYHASYTLAGMLERADRRSERRELRAMLRTIRRRAEQVSA